MMDDFRLMIGEGGSGEAGAVGGYGLAVGMGHPAKVL